MAFIRFKDGRNRIVSAEQGLTIWRIMNGEEKGTAKQQAFCKQLHRVYLSVDKAPESYQKWYNNQFKPSPLSNIALPYKD
jgi:hypothetical protein